jgi:hypothetical protein
MKRILRFLTAVLYGLTAIVYDFDGVCGVSKDGEVPR